jgi:hypothetical protein|tara:strand:+ start:634 stop:843 length:210 start_codon:yes stop_codon:yes gene_type:complete
MVTNKHHIIVTTEEQEMIVNALAFFDEAYLGNSPLTARDLINKWREIASGTRLSHLDDLATKIKDATSN